MDQEKMDYNNTSTFHIYERKFKAVQLLLEKYRYNLMKNLEYYREINIEVKIAETEIHVNDFRKLTFN